MKNQNRIHYKRKKNRNIVPAKLRLKGDRTWDDNEWLEEIKDIAQGDYDIYIGR